MVNRKENPVLVGELSFLSKPNITGWCHGILKDKKTGEKFKVSGTALTGLKTHKEYELQGEWSQYNGEPQIKVLHAVPYVEASLSSLTRYLIAQYKNLGIKTADMLVERWKADGKTLEELRQQLVYEPYRLEDWANKQPGLKRALVYQSVNEGDFPEMDQLYRALLLQFRSGQNNEVLVTDSAMKKVARYLLGLKIEGPLVLGTDKVTRSVGEAMDLFLEDPFAPMFTVSGYSFKAADKVWKSLKKPWNHENRLSALGYYVLTEACETGGHTFLPEKAFERAIDLFDRDIELSDVLRAMKSKAVPVKVEGDAYYTEPLWVAETEVAKILQDKLNDKGEPLLSLSEEKITNLMHEIEAKKGINLDPQQKEALLGIATSTQKVHTLTAMPGCGKTAIMEFLAQLVQKDDQQKLEIDFMAPTGKASKVLNGRVKPYGLSATTIHAAIGWGGMPQTVEADIVVVDESSMVDLPLMYQFLSRTNPKAHLIFIGDPDQLPSVGPGHILHDILKMPFDHHQLKEVHRNAGDILNLVKTIKRGEYETFHGKDVMTYGLPDPTDKMEKFLDLYTKEVSKRPDGLKKVGLLTGMRKGDPTKPGWNVTYLNRALQERYNPYGSTVSGLSVREGDRIIVRKNQRFETEDAKTKTAKVEYIANGDTGVLKEVVFKESNKIDSIQLALDDGRHLTLPGDVLTTMDLGYALTIHQAQGSEFECAFVVMQNGQPGLFNRKLFYTGVSRAKDQLYLFGDRTTFKSLVHRTGEKRYSKLVERVMNTIDAEAHYQQDDQLILFEEDGASSVSTTATTPVQTNSKRPRF